MTRYVYIRLFFTAASLFCFIMNSAQQQKIDSLIKLLAVQNTDTGTAKTLGKISWEYLLSGRYEKTREYAERAISTINKSNDTSAPVLNSFAKTKTNALNNIAGSWYRQGEFGNALQWYSSALKSALTVKGRAGKSFCSMIFGNVGNIFREKANYGLALKYYFNTLRIKEELGEERAIGIWMGNIGITYRMMENYDMALKYFRESLTHSQRANDRNSVSHQIANIGSVHFYLQEYDSALIYYTKGKQLCEEIGELGSLASHLGNLGNVYNQIEKYDLAAEHYLQALKLSEMNGEKSGMAVHMGNIGTAFYKSRKFTEAERYLKAAAALNEQLANYPNLRDNYFNLTDVYTATRRFDLGLRAYKLYIAARDSVFSTENTKKTVQAQMQYEFDKKEAETKATQAKKDAVAEEEKRRQEIIFWTVVAGLTLVILFAAFIFRALRQKQKANAEILQQKHIIEEKQKEILDSIHYAKRIQTALLTPEKYIQRMLTQLNRLNK